MSLVSAAGPLAEALDGDGFGPASSVDDKLFYDNLGNRIPRAVIDESAAMVLKHRQEITFGAKALDAMPVIDGKQTIGPREFKQLCRAKVLAAYAPFTLVVAGVVSTARRVGSSQAPTGNQAGGENLILIDCCFRQSACRRAT
jgi:hypothetical protein